LYLVHRVPYPPDKGDRIRAFHVLRFLAARGRVHLACLADEPVGDDVLPALGRYCARVAVVPLSRARWARSALALARGRTATEGAFHCPALHKVVAEWARQTRFDACLASASSMVPYLRRPGLRGVPAVIDLVDVDSQKWLDYAAAGRGPRSWLYRLEGRRLRRLEGGLPAWARAVTLASAAEAELFTTFCRPGRVCPITNGVDLEYFRPVNDPGGTRCAFVGALDYRPNVDAAVWFCRTVWPQVRRREPAATFCLVGRRPAPAVLGLADLPGVEVVGDVPDVRPHVAGASVVVVPLRIARGVQNKVLEALAMAKAVVASGQALAGLSARPGAELLQASAPEEWAAAVLGLFAEPALRRALGSAGRRYVEEHHRWEVCLEEFARLLLPDARRRTSDHAGVNQGPGENSDFIEKNG
jgi:sugar transferase (PEP-CTERM/EpsH1 system associated)